MPRKGPDLCLSHLEAEIAAVPGHMLMGLTDREQWHLDSWFWRPRSPRSKAGAWHRPESGAEPAESCEFVGGGAVVLALS